MDDRSVMPAQNDDESKKARGPALEGTSAELVGSPSDSSAPAAAPRALEDLRRRLLDLSLRNPLLRFKPSGKSVVRVVDELPDQLFATLQGGGFMHISPVPEPTLDELIQAGYVSIDPETDDTNRLKDPPTAPEWAAHIGLATDHELPLPTGDVESASDKHSDNAIQTLYFPPELDGRLQQLRSKTRTVEQETGVNVLYMAFGFLRWYENRESTDVKIAPLLLLQVRLTRGELNKETKTYDYQVKWDADEVVPNLTLIERVRRDFHVELPSPVDPDTGTTLAPEAYLKAVQDTLKQARIDERWKVQRQVALAPFNFSRLLMYLDLDPASWPDDALNKHSLVDLLLHGTAGGGGGDVTDDYAIDELPQVHDNFPLIDNADSSQHSALVDAIKGKSLVVEGPPGTGKSQTITNLIAAALAQGKSVLFVAEKMAALNVVHHRLEQAGLSNYLLELHSHKADKRAVLESLERRIRNGSQPEPKTQFNKVLNDYEATRKALTLYVDTVNANWRNTGATCATLLNRAVRLRHGLEADVAELDADFSPDISSATIADIELTARSLGSIIKACVVDSPEGALRNHPWRGVNNARLHPTDDKRLLGLAEAWQAKLPAVAQQIDATLNTIAGWSPQTPLSIAAMQQLAVDLGKLPEVKPEVDPGSVATLNTEALAQVEALLRAAQFARKHFQALSKTTQEPWVEGSKSVAEPIAALERVAATGISQQATLLDLRDALGELAAQATGFDQLHTAMQDVGQLLGPGWAAALEPTPEGVASLRTLVDSLAPLNQDLANLADGQLAAPEAGRGIQLLGTELPALHKERARLFRWFTMASPLDPETITTIHKQATTDGIGRFFSGDWWHARGVIKGWSQIAAKVSEAGEELPALATFLLREQALWDHADVRAVPATFLDGYNTPVEKLQSLNAWYSTLKDRFGSGFGAQARLGNELRQCSTQPLQQLLTWRTEHLVDLCSAAEQALAQLSEMFPRSSANNAGAQLAGERSALRLLLDPLQAAEPQLSAPLKDHNRTSLAEAAAVFDQVTALREAEANWTTNLAAVAAHFPNLILPNTPVTATMEDLRVLLASWRLATQLRTALATPGLGNHLAQHVSAAHFVQLVNHAGKLTSVLDAMAKARQAFMDEAELDEAVWGAELSATLAAHSQRLTDALANPSALRPWIDLIRLLEEINNQGLTGAVTALRELRVPHDQWDRFVLASLYQTIATQVMQGSPLLHDFTAARHQAKLDAFRNLDQQLLELQRQRIAAVVSKCQPPEGRSGGKVADLTEMGLIRHEIGKSKRHIALRQLVARAGDALQALKPCWMMSPMSVAQFLPRGAVTFDLVIMDEASQIRPEDAMGAIARGSQVVVVGDPNQLPPTSFFSVAIEVDEEEATTAEDSESILDALTPVLPTRTLRWHYRSRHESLISFSNMHFYKGRLVVFPSPTPESTEMGVGLTRVPNGTFLKGRNLREAEAVAEAVRTLLVTKPETSLGVVAMNRDQADQIEATIERFEREDVEFRRAMSANAKTDEPLFIKNLENVQGDEREVIFISYTYGPEKPGGKVMQRFGPINQDVGWRRLNVLFTRSRQRVQVFSSLDPSDILAASGGRGVTAMRDYLHFAATGELRGLQGGVLETEHPPDSDFEVSVAQALADHGFTVGCQVGVAGYRIDLAVKDPGNPGRYLMGIECDGAAYHSAKSARDRDRLRQQVLEGLGWTIRRIWSTDWFRDPGGTLARIVEELRRTATPMQPELPLELAGEAISLNVHEPASEDSTPADAAPPETGAQRTVPQLNTEGLDLQDRLEELRHHVIEPAFPNTPPNKRLLRNSMVDALTAERPATKEEFVRLIPEYLRESTSAEEARAYLHAVLEIIDEAIAEGVT